MVLSTTKKPTLSEKEFNVLKCAAKGLSEPETALELFVAVNTVKTHRRNTIKKLRARNITHAVTLAYVTGVFRGVLKECPYCGKKPGEA